MGRTWPGPLPDEALVLRPADPVRQARRRSVRPRAGGPAALDGDAHGRRASRHGRRGVRARGGVRGVGRRTHGDAVRRHVPGAHDRVGAVRHRSRLHVDAAGRSLHRRGRRVPRVHRRALGDDRTRPPGDRLVGSPEPCRRRPARDLARLVPAAIGEPRGRDRALEDEPGDRRERRASRDPRPDAADRQDRGRGVPDRADALAHLADRRREARGDAGRRALLLGRRVRHDGRGDRAVRG